MEVLDQQSSHLRRKCHLKVFDTHLFENYVKTLNIERISHTSNKLINHLHINTFSFTAHKEKH